MPEILSTEWNDDDDIDSEADDLGEGDDGTVTYQVSFYGADYTVDSIVKRLNNKVFYVPPFQRGYVWTSRQGSRFIESLLLGLPVPGIFLSREEPTRKHLIIDGQQRLKTIQRFYNGELKLRNVDARWNGKRYEDLKYSEKIDLDDSIIHATIFSQLHPEEDDTSIHLVFERLNTGGQKLHPQEVRNCVDHGRLIKLLDRCNDIESWRKIFGDKSLRLRDQELILRFFALLYGEKYSRPMREYLNKFSRKNRQISSEKAEEWFRIFERLIDIVYESLGERAFRPERTLNPAIYEAVMVGLHYRLESGRICEERIIRKLYDILLEDDKFRETYLAFSTSEKHVKNRKDIALKVFSRD